MSMDTEEMISAQPMDAAVVVGGCDKTVPAQLMGAISANRPAVQLITGPMMTARHEGERRRLHRLPPFLGDVSGRRVKRPTDRRCGIPSRYDGRDLPRNGNRQHNGLYRRDLGNGFAGNGCDPSRARRPPSCGGRVWKRAVEIARSGLTPDKVVTEKSVENALRVLLAIGGSNQRHYPSDGHRRPRRSQRFARPLKRNQRRDTCFSQPETFR